MACVSLVGREQDHMSLDMLSIASWLHICLLRMVELTCTKGKIVSPIYIYIYMYIYIYVYIYIVCYC